MKSSAVFVRILLVWFFLSPMSVYACDETLVMMLTAQNPTSEFSRIILAFTSDLATLGSSLKLAQKDNYDPELKKVMATWLDFATRYMTSPPKEAASDSNWNQKMKDTAQTIGKIRKLIKEKDFFLAHDLVLDLSSRIGVFFECFGITSEHELFIETSADLIALERAISVLDYEAAHQLIDSLQADYEKFAQMAPEESVSILSMLKDQIKETTSLLTQKASQDKLQALLEQMRSAFETVRSHILMIEWFEKQD